MNKNINKIISINNSNNKFYKLILILRVDVSSNITMGRRLRDSINQCFRKRDRRHEGRIWIRASRVRKRVVRTQRRARKYVSLAGSYSLYKGEDFYRENCEGSWNVIGSNCYANKTDWRSNFRQFGY